MPITVTAVVPAGGVRQSWVFGRIAISEVVAATGVVLLVNLKNATTVPLFVSTTCGVPRVVAPVPSVIVALVPVMALFAVGPGVNGDWFMASSSTLSSYIHCMSSGIVAVQHMP